jgi:hypothetical protein
MTLTSRMAFAPMRAMLFAAFLNTILKRTLLLVVASALVLTASLAHAQTTPTVSCEDVKNACTIERKVAEQIARDTNESCQDACPSGNSSCRDTCKAAKTAAIAAATAAYPTCLNTACTTGMSCEEQAETSRHDCDEKGRDDASNCIRGTCAAGDTACTGACSNTKNVTLAACGAAEATTRATTCVIGVDCVKACSNTEHACSEASRDAEKICRSTCAGDAACRASCEAARDTAVDTCLRTESTCVAVCIAPPAVCPCAADWAAIPADAAHWPPAPGYVVNAVLRASAVQCKLESAINNGQQSIQASTLPSLSCTTSANNPRPITVKGDYNACVTAINNYAATLSAASVPVSGYPPGCSTLP